MKATLVTFALALLGTGAPAWVSAAETTTPAAPGAAAPSEPGKVDINTADSAALEAIPEIGTNFANAVMAARPFRSVDELDRVLKIGPEKMAELRKKVTASPVKPTASPGENPTATESKPPAFNDGKAISRKEVGERYEKGTEPSPAKKPEPRK